MPWKLFLKSATHFFETIQMQEIKLPTDRLKQFAKTLDASISSQNFGSEPSGKHWTSAWEKRDEMTEKRKRHLFDKLELTESFSFVST